MYQFFVNVSHIYLENEASSFEMSVKLVCFFSKENLLLQKVAVKIWKIIC